VGAVTCILRSPRERILQVLCYEAGALAVIAPLFSLAAGETMARSYLLMAALSVAAMGWACAFNTVYDWLEQRWTGRLASDRPHRWRLVHALAFEASQVVVSCPLIYWLTDLGWLQSLAADVALTGAYTVYGYLFHWVFDRLRPVRPRTFGPAPAHKWRIVRLRPVSRTSVASRSSR
jgi:uncharacterized membrane protein